MRPLLTLCMSLCLAGAGSGQTTLLELGGPVPGGEFGYSIATVGDLDSDGVPEFMVGAPRYNLVGTQVLGEPSAWGLVSVFSGATGKTLYRFRGRLKDPNAGTVVAGAGDLDEDGVPDLLYSGAGTCCYPSSVRARSGATGVQLHHVPGVVPFSKDLGHQLLGQLDLDLDGADDFVATTVLGANLIAISGATGQTLYTVPTPGGTAGYGESLASISDLDGDGVPEVLIGVLVPGEVRVLSGASGTELYRVSGFGPIQFGSLLANLGDLDGDAIDDFGVGARTLNPAIPDGRVYVFSGVDGDLIHALHGGKPSGFAVKLEQTFPSSLCGAGDLDGDGIPDILAGVLAEGGSGWRGRVIVFSGADGSVLRSLRGPKYSEFGFSLAPVGDLDGGGVSDFAVGDPDRQALPNGPPGVVTIFTGERSPGVYCTAKTNSQGCTPTIWADGIASATGSGVVVSAHSVINEQSGALLLGRDAAQQPFKGGFRCVGSVVWRVYDFSEGTPSAYFAEPDCSGAFYSVLSGKFLTTVAGFEVGQTVYAQYYYADPGDPLGAGFSDAIRFDVLP